MTILGLGDLALVLVMGPLAAEAACQDRGCARQHSGQGVCVDLWTLSAAALGASYDLAAGGFSGSCNCSSQDCDCRCFKRVGDQGGPACQKSKDCSKKKGTCLKQGSQPEGSKDLGWCSKKSRCKCYKSAPPVPPPATTCQGEPPSCQCTTQCHCSSPDCQATVTSTVTSSTATGTLATGAQATATIGTPATGTEGPTTGSDTTVDPPTTGATTTSLTSTTKSPAPVPTTTTPNVCGDCPQTQYDNRCTNPPTDPHGGLGCGGCGKQACRFCGFNHFPACPPKPATLVPPPVTAAPVIKDVVKIGFVNRCPNTLWLGAQGLSESSPDFIFNGMKVSAPRGGGWVLEAGTNDSITIPKDWTAGRFWARTGCTGTPGVDFRCETGDCGPWIECANGQVARGGEPPVTLAEFTLNGGGQQDYFDISLVDGFNLPMVISVVTPYPWPQGNEYWCTSPVCSFDINSVCPPELAKQGREGVVACYSACMKFDTDAYCCRGQYNQPETCTVDTWDVDYPHMVFEKHCPQAYSYAYDDNTSTFVCKNTDYDIIFC